ncbi:hypothetical protein NUH16_003213 [Penicillium rubens]|nr:hypothetical protein NUH16_003213 [Penicillium rubens]
MPPCNTNSEMDNLNFLRILSRLDARALRAERAQAKLEQELSATEANAKQMAAELDQVSKLAEIFYEVSQRMGLVVDHLLKKRGVREREHEPESDHEPESVKKMLEEVLKELEGDSKATERYDNENENGGSEATQPAD